jgi:hypothetical protein
MATVRAKKRSVFGGTKDPNRGTWTTQQRWADYVGKFDVDVFSNPRSKIVADVHCMLERGDDAFGGYEIGDRIAGVYRVTSTHRKPIGPGEIARTKGLDVEWGYRNATENTRVWIQPPYEIADEAVDHFGHTRFTALLRFDPPVGWFRRLYRLSELVCVPADKRFFFDPPPGVDPSSPPIPHVLFYRRAEDVTREVLRHCISWRPR